MISKTLRSLAFALFLLPAAAFAALPNPAAPVRYMVLGDSLAAGYKAMPATAGYAYQLYLGRAFGDYTNVLFDNASVPGATSADLLNFQLPQVQRFQPNVVTISVGGNDLLALLTSPDPIGELPGVLAGFAQNMAGSLTLLCLGMPEGGRIFVQNLYEIPEIPLTQQAVPLFNQVLNQTVFAVGQSPACVGRSLGVADVYSAFRGEQGLLLIERYQKKGIEVLEVHPTNKGHRVIEAAFRALIAQ